MCKLRGDDDYLDNAAGDQAGNTEEFQYYNADADVGACIGDHWVSFLIESNLLCPPTRTSTPLVYMYYVRMP